jgi:hypothetical protein
MTMKNKISQRNDTNVDVLIMGDCFNLEGIDSKFIEETTGLKTFNYATFSNHTIVSSYLLLKNHLKHNSRKPRYMVINFIPELTTVTEKTFFQKNLSFMYHMKDGNFLSFVPIVGFEKAVQMQIPSLKNKDFFLKGRFKKGLAQAQEIKDFENNLMDHRGQYTRHQKESYTTCLPPTGVIFDYKPSPFFLKYLHKILDLAKANNIMVLFPMFTAPEDMYNNLYATSHVAEIYFNLLGQLKKEYPNLIFWGWQDDFSNRSLYRDCIHLDEKGSSLMSQKLAEIIFILNSKLH